MSRRQRNRRRRDEISKRSLPTSFSRLDRTPLSPYELQRYVEMNDPIINNRVNRRIGYVTQNKFASVRGETPSTQKRDQAYQSWRVKTPVVSGSSRRSQQSGQRNVKADARSVCEQRRERAEVMFATGVAGSRGQRAPVWTSRSKVRCK